MSQATRPLNNELIYGYLWLQKFFPKKSILSRHDKTILGLPENSVSVILTYWKKDKNKNGDIIYLKKQMSTQNYQPLYC